MNAEMVKQLLDACFLAKKIVETMPPLPDGMVPRHVHVMDAVHKLRREIKKVHVGDVSAEMKSTAPSVTRLIGELEKMGYLTKTADSRDKRYVSIDLSEKGRAFHSKYVVAFHEKLARSLRNLDDDDCRAAMEVVRVLLDKVRAATRNTPKKEKK